MDPENLRFLHQDAVRSHNVEIFSKKGHTFLSGAKWIECLGQGHPPNAVISKDDGELFLIARAIRDGHHTPGNYRSRYQRTYIPNPPHGENSHAVETYEILAATPGSLIWVPSSPDRISEIDNAVIGGKNHKGDCLLVCRARKSEGGPGILPFWNHGPSCFIPGYVNIDSEDKHCCFVWKDEEFLRDRYEVLVAPHHEGRSTIVSVSSLTDGATIADNMLGTDEPWTTSWISPLYQGWEDFHNWVAHI